MRHKIICIDRMCGSGGKEIGRLVSKKLGIGFHDSNLLELAKEHGGITSSSLDDSDEKATNPFYYKLIYEGNENVKQEQPATEMLFHLQSAVIQQIAKEEDSVIVGRCADFILKDDDVDILSVFITAPLADRITREMDVDDRQGNLSARWICAVKTIITILQRETGAKRIRTILFLIAPNLVSKGRWIFYAASTGTLWGNEKLFIKLIRSRKHKMYNNFRYGKFELVTSFCMR